MVLILRNAGVVLLRHRILREWGLNFWMNLVSLRPNGVKFLLSDVKWWLTSLTLVLLTDRFFNLFVLLWKFGLFQIEPAEGSRLLHAILRLDDSVRPNFFFVFAFLNDLIDRFFRFLLVVQVTLVRSWLNIHWIDFWVSLCKRFLNKLVGVEVLDN